MVCFVICKNIVQVGVMRPYALGTGAIALLLLVACFRRRTQRRVRRLKADEERVVILGASTTDGIGAAIASESIARGVRRVLLVARNKEGLERVRDQLVAQHGKSAAGVICHVADCSSEAGVVSVREAAVAQFCGVDTLHIVFGSMVDNTLLGVTGNDPIHDGHNAGEASPSGIAKLHAAVERACAINVTGTALVLAALIPLLQTSSKNPHVCVIGSLASLIPAPTRAIYAAAKAAQQQLVLGVATECTSQARAPGRSLVKFTVLAPGSVATSFTPRANPNAIGPAEVARTALAKVDAGATGVVPVPAKYFAAWILSIFAPHIVERGAHAKYNY